MIETYEPKLPQEKPKIEKTPEELLGLLIKIDISDPSNIIQTLGTFSGSGSALGALGLLETLDTEDLNKIKEAVSFMIEKLTTMTIDMGDSGVLNEKVLLRVVNSILDERRMPD